MCLVTGPLQAFDFPTKKQLDAGLQPIPYQEAVDQAGKDSKFTLLYFWADWCSNCETFSDKVLSNPQIIETMNKDFKFVSIDIDKDRPLAQEFKVMAVPTMIFLEKSGKPASVLPGAIPGEIFTLVLDYMASGSYKDLEFAEYFEKTIRDKFPQVGGAPIKAVVLARQAFAKTKSPVNQQLTVNFLHCLVRGLSPHTYWAGVTMSVKKLLRSGQSEEPAIGKSNLFEQLPNLYNSEPIEHN
jgi:thioredoxin 1